MEPLSALAARGAGPPSPPPILSGIALAADCGSREATEMMSPAMQSWMSPLLGPDGDGGPKLWQKGHWIWPEAFNAKADGLGSLATRESETVRRVATAAASSRRAYSEREADMEVFKGLKKMYLLKQGRRVEGMDAMLELVEAERREVLLNRHIIEGKVRAALR